MNDSKMISKQGTVMPLVALVFASLVGAVVTVLRVKWTGNSHYFLLVGNLFLAWLPLLFALAVYRRHQRGERRSWQLGALTALWMLFLPNAPYIFTDLIHLDRWFANHYWVDLSLVLMVALTGFLAGFMSLYLMQSMAAQRWGRLAGWGLVVTATGLSGFGIYLGRILRWNSWDVIVHPVRLSHSIGHWATHPLANPATTFAFPLLFATFLFLGYVMLYALTHLQPARTSAECGMGSAE